MRLLHVVVPAVLFVLLPVSSAFGSVGFASARTFPAGANPGAVAIGDFNGDGKPDVVVVDDAASNTNSQNVNVLLNNGDGTFTRVATSLDNMIPLGVAVADFNHDGRLDIALFGQSFFLVLFGNGDGTFAPPGTQYPLTGNYPNSLAVGDFNGDGAPDVAIAFVNSSTIELFSNSGTGTFTDLGATPACGNPGSLAVADFNHDGNQDIAVACWSGSVSVMLGDGQDHFRTVPVNSFIPDPVSIATADVNGDGQLDLVTANSSGSSASVLLGNGDGTFRVSSPIVLPAKPISVAIADINGDGKPDVLELTDGANDLAVLIGNGDGTFKAPAVFNAGGAPFSGPGDHSIVVADFNGDGKPDVIATSDGLNVSLLLGMGDGTFAPTATSFLTGAGTTWVAAGDFNGDKIPDLVVANSAANTVSIFAGQGQGQFTAGATYSVGVDPEFVTVADVNGDGKLDIIAVSKGDAVTPGSVSILLGQGDGTFTSAASLSPGTAPVAAAVADFDNNGKLDLAVVNEGDNTTQSTVAVFLGNGDGSFSGPTSFSVGVSPRAIAAAKLTTSGNIDLVVANFLNGDLSVLEGSGTGSFTFKGYLSLPLIAPWASVAIADLNGDGLPDVISPGGNGVVVFLNQGNYQFSLAQTFLAEPGVMRVAAGDFDGDGYQDIVAVGQSTGVDLLRGNGDGTLKPYISFGAGLSPWSFTVNDINSDGLPDVLVATPGVDPLPPAVTILLNAMGLSASIASTPNPSEYAQPVTFTADFVPSLRQGVVGTAVFSDSGSVLGSAPLDSNGQGQFQTVLSVGTHTISAQYSGTAFVPVEKSVVQTVNQAASVINVTSSANPALTGAPVTLTATFTGTYGGSSSGTFSFAEGSNILSTGSLNASGQATLAKADWPAGQHNLVINYSGDSNLLAGATAYSEEIQNPTTTTIGLSSSSSVVGANVILSATVTSAAQPIPTGTVGFIADGSTPIGSAALDGSGNATLNTATIPAGVHAVSASYQGDSFSAASAAQATSLSVADFALTAQPSAASVRAGQSTTITISVSAVAGFNSSVSLSCNNLPALSTGTFTPAMVTVGTSPVTSTLVIQTTGPAAALTQPPALPNSTGSGPMLATLAFGIFGVTLVATRSRKRPVIVAILALTFGSALVSCSGGGGTTSPPPGPTTPPGTANVALVANSTVNGTSVSHQLPISITVTP